MTVEERRMSHHFNKIAGDNLILSPAKASRVKVLVHEVPCEHLMPVSAAPVECFGSGSPKVNYKRQAAATQGRWQSQQSPPVGVGCPRFGLFQCFRLVVGVAFPTRAAASSSIMRKAAPHADCGQYVFWDDL
ncbi:hypothetical protein MAPG_08363 [Magnaporthiopsis poae ATCC 64411]|uniref:Uncharacterized protein n=1 Tax=Magnaporthiopsis poae (strain ATCC 64411 / 73-15) TaxID=644358 RepID=A0A0C4E761_MAGP6|nr:hypothetical protein MAPG_08363 [Magnaporthiopsis poae ATCC 64411]